jgi:hypothetical protein
MVGDSFECLFLLPVTSMPLSEALSPTNGAGAF